MNKQEETRDLVNPNDRTVAPLTEAALLARVETVRRITRAVMKDGVHYGKIPGTPKASLWQPGAEILATTFQLNASFDLTDKIEDFAEPFFMYRIKAVLRNVNGGFAGESEAVWNSKESRYYCRGGEACKCNEHHDVPAYKQDPYMLQETGIQQARKRAFVSVVRTVTGASELFTQDLEDMATGGAADASDAPMGYCIQHGKPFTKKTGIAKGTKRPYAFWSCPEKDGKGWCQHKPEEWLFEEFKKMGITSNKGRDEALATLELGAWADYSKGKTFKFIVDDILLRLQPPVAPGEADGVDAAAPAGKPAVEGVKA